LGVLRVNVCSEGGAVLFFVAFVAIVYRIDR